MNTLKHFSSSSGRMLARAAGRSLLAALILRGALGSFSSFAEGPAQAAPASPTSDEIQIQAERGQPLAQFRMGVIYAEGLGVATDSTAAFRWFQRAAQQGLAEAQHQVASMYLKGNGVTKNDAEGVKWARKAAEQGCAPAQHTLGFAYASGTGVVADMAEAAKWYRRAAEQGHPFAQHNLGNLYAKGDGVKQDLAEAAKWFREAAEQGASASQYHLGVCFDTGQGVRFNPSEAANWFRKAAEQGDAEAQFRVAEFAYLGRGVPVDYVESYQWLNLAAAQGHPGALERRSEVADKMTREQLAEAQRRSAHWLAKFQPAQPDPVDKRFKPAVSVAIPRGSGTGFFITSSGHLLTCHHVVANATRILVRTKHGEYPAQIVQEDRVNDVALLKVSGVFRDLPIVPSRHVSLGDSVFTIGFPNPPIQGIEPKLTRGEINSLGGVRDDPRQFQTSASVNSGNSGGPLLNAHGQVIGIVNLRIDEIKTLQDTGAVLRNVNYALKSSYILALLETVRELDGKLKEPSRPRKLKFEDVVKAAEESVAWLVVY